MAEQSWEGLNKYPTIVADPPWRYALDIGTPDRNKHMKERK